MSESEKYKKRIIDFLSVRILFASTTKEQIYDTLRRTLPCEVIVKENIGNTDNDEVIFRSGTESTTTTFHYDKRFTEDDIKISRYCYWLKKID